jgi:hypothetical protein
MAERVFTVIAESVSLGALLRTHDSAGSVPDAVPASLGDAVLVETNLVYREIRRLVVREGFALTQDFTEDLSTYAAIPLLSLQVIFDQRRLPFRDNVSGLRVLHRLRGDLALPFEFLQLHLRSNFLLHESAHAAFECATGAPDVRPKDDPGTAAILAFAGESFANACELVALNCVDDPELRKVMALSNYFSPQDRRDVLVRRAIEAFGVGKTISLIAMTRLAFYHRGAVSRREFVDTTWDQLGPPDRAPPSWLAELCFYDFGKNLRFRQETARIYAQAWGYDDAYRRVVDLSPLEVARSNPWIASALLRLEDQVGAHAGR